jgi:hypothetical protein
VLSRFNVVTFIISKGETERLRVATYIKRYNTDAVISHLRSNFKTSPSGSMIPFIQSRISENHEYRYGTIS